MSTQLMDEEQQELVRGFVEESREMLDEVEPLLIELERTSDLSGDADPEAINAIFRLFHSLKGGAGFLGLDSLSRLTHIAETLLDLFRKELAPLTGDHVDLLMRTCDLLRQIIDNIEEQSDDGGFEDDTDLIIEELRQVISQEAGASTGQDTERTTQPILEAESPPIAVDRPESQSGQSPDTIPKAITPEMVEQFASGGDEQLKTAQETLQNLEKGPDNQDLISRALHALHNFTETAGSLGYQDLEVLSRRLETALERMQQGEIPADRDLLALLLEILDTLRQTVAKLAQGEPPQIPGVTGWVNLLNDSLARLGCSDRKGDAEPRQQPSEAPDKSPQVENRSSQVERRSGEDRRQIADRRAGVRQTVRVDVEKLDLLLDLVGEMVVAQAMVAYSPDLKGLEGQLKNFHESVIYMEKITRDLHDMTVSLRATPLSATFRGMIRLVRSLSAKTGKKVDLDIIGEEIEMDKTVIEHINDPLVHMIRNAIDHGIEPPQERQIAGKPEAGRLTLEATYSEGEIRITVQDDGRGLDRDKITAKAIERGLVNGDGADLSDEDVYQLLFQPGFSTADKVSDVSGRGVGMDVVKSKIEEIHGEVEVHSEKGRGTSIILRIPPDIVIIGDVFIRAGDAFSAILQLDDRFKRARHEREVCDSD